MHKINTAHMCTQRLRVARWTGEHARTQTHTITTTTVIRDCGKWVDKTHNKLEVSSILNLSFLCGQTEGALFNTGGLSL